MNITYEIRQNEDIIQVQMSGIFSLKEFDAFYKGLMQTISKEKIWSILWDLREVDLSKVNRELISSVIEHISLWSDKKRQGGKAACVMKDDFGYGMGRMFEMIAYGKLDPSIKIFKDVDEAMSWLDAN